MQNLPKKVRSKKLSSRVDLTAMVSVSFLLIIFFMLVGELSKPKVLDLSLPDKEGGHGCPGCTRGNRLYTILLDQNDKIITYSGILEFDQNTVKKVEFGKDAIRKEVYQKKKEVSDYMISVGKPKNGVIVIIKPSPKSNFKNLVEILDEMRIANIDTFSIVDEFTSEESKLLASK
ncbi:Biopolymer transport protein ExbD/TolR [Flavobacterium sp. CF108]|uniref:ExbD/TolR family protein n=1 Tax=unclassified Flavobacterium TaxID=196869 RepID=UPI0008B35C9F|nr:MULTISPECIES: biopolymer transporter ExbD [unclassified Flavobacterium]SEO29361.1 Biopolymer transport protein ExbD/TolR [Flavobacterium sp. fv08]SHG43447.1 Biopolymer transport protein ExbD/TolR [Flavobacterium sp. CF108]